MNSLTTMVLSLFVALLVTLVGVASTADAAPIGINFVGGSPPENNGTPDAMDPADVAGHPDVAQSNWNNLTGASGTDISITDEDGNDNGGALTVTYDAGLGTWSTGAASDGTPGIDDNGDQQMMDGYLDADGASQGTDSTIVVVSGIPFSRYQVWVYGDGFNPEDRRYQYTLNPGETTEQVVAFTDPQDDLFAGTYGPIITDDTTPGTATQTGLFENVTGSSFTLEVAGLNDDPQYPRGVLNGIQVIPEPASLALLVLGGAAMLAARRQRA